LNFSAEVCSTWRRSISCEDVITRSPPTITTGNFAVFSQSLRSTTLVFMALLERYSILYDKINP
uniref:Ovule protein n=1 Tax=Anisakis simplex TaxID=6269 RepID=A0A0M3JFJ4_ANISI